MASRNLAKHSLASERAARSDERRTQIVRAAYEAIAETGFEGLRMREIGRRAGLDHSTLHYYFNGKEALIDGVMDYIVKRLSLGREPGGSAATLSPRGQLDAHFRALLRQGREHPEMFLVLQEIHARSARDPDIRHVMAKNERAWKSFLMEILRDGVRRKEFSASLKVEAAADAILSLIRGLNLGYSENVSNEERALRQLMSWLTQS